MAKKERNLKKTGLIKKTALKNVPKKGKIEKKKITPEKKPEVKKKKEVKVKERKTLPELQEPYVNLRCRHCYLVDGYAKTEKVCHHCGAEIYEIDII